MTSSRATGVVGTATKTKTRPLTASIVMMIMPFFLPILLVVRAASAQDVIVIGAGISGLNAAYELCSRNYSVTVLESRNRTGGRVSTVTIGAGMEAVKAEAGAGWLHGASKSQASLA